MLASCSTACPAALYPALIEPERLLRGDGGLFVPDGVTGPQSNPLWDGSVLLLRTRKLLLGTEGLVAL